MAALARVDVWRAVSTIALAAFVVSFFVGGFSVPGWGWVALLLSGVAFGVEQVLVRRGGTGPKRPPGEVP
jgi:hypothetical protein